MLGEFTWRNEIFREALDEITNYLPFFIHQSIELSHFGKERVFFSQKTIFSDSTPPTPTLRTNLSEVNSQNNNSNKFNNDLNQEQIEISSTTSRKLHIPSPPNTNNNNNNESSSSLFSPMNTSRAPSPSTKYGAGSPGRGKKNSPIEIIEKILQHTFYVIESLCKFDCGKKDLYLCGNTNFISNYSLFCFFLEYFSQ